MGDWRDIHIGFENDGLKIGGIEVWEEKWRERGAIQLPHPEHRDQRHGFNIYEVGSVKHPVRFAAGKLSKGVWGFFVPA